MSGGRGQVAAPLAALVAVTVGAYLPALPGEFQLDDGDILRSARVRDLGAFAAPAAWSPSGRPLTAFTFALDHALHGFDTRGWHATSLALHLVAIVLAFGLARRVSARAGVPRPGVAALAAAAIFALHPIQTESVSYLSQRAEVLAALLTFAGVLLLLRADDAPRRGRRVALVAGALATHALGLASKPSAAVMPALWLAIAVALPTAGERALSRARRLASRLPAALPLLALSGAAALGGLWATRGSAHAGLDVPGAPWPLYVATELRVVPRYLALLLWPAGQNVDWDVRFATRLAEPGVLAGAALVAGVVALAAVGSRRDGEDARSAAARAAAVGIVWFLVALSPTLLVPLADPLAEHRAYLATWGFGIAVAAGASALHERLASRRGLLGLGACAAAAVVALATATARRNEVWRTPLALWADAAARSPGKGRPHANLCRALLLAGDPHRAVAACGRALALGVPGQEQVPLRYLALALMRLGRLEEARDRVLAFRDRAALEGDTLAVLAKVELTAGRGEEAERHARAGIAADGAPRAFVALGEIREARGDLAGAAEAYARAAEREPGEGLPLVALGRVLERRGMPREACEAYARAADGAEFSASVRNARARSAELACPR